MSDNQTVGGILKDARERLGYSPQKVLDETGVSKNYLQNLEADLIKRHSAGVLYKLSGLYDIPLKPLLILAGVIIPKTHE